MSNQRKSAQIKRVSVDRLHHAWRLPAAELAALGAFNRDDNLEKVFVAGLPEWAETLYVALGGPEGATHDNFVELEFKTDGYVRRFTLGFEQGVAIDALTRSQVGGTLTVVASNITAGDRTFLTAYCVNRQRTDEDAADAYWYASYTAGVQYPVPPGAVAIIANTGDPAFNWRNYDATGAAVSIPDNLAVGVTTDLKGGWFIPSVAFSAQWRIRV